MIINGRYVNYTDFGCTKYIRKHRFMVWTDEHGECIILFGLRTLHSTRTGRCLLDRYAPTIELQNNKNNNNNTEITNVRELPCNNTLCCHQHQILFYVQNECIKHGKNETICVLVGYERECVVCLWSAARVRESVHDDVQLYTESREILLFSACHKPQKHTACDQPI